MNDDRLNQFSQQGRRARWFLFALSYFLAYGLTDWLYRYSFIEIHPLAAPAGYVLGFEVSLASLATVSPVVLSCVCAVCGQAPRAWLVAALGAAAGTFGAVLLFAFAALWPENTGEAMVMFELNAIAAGLFIGVHFFGAVAHRRRKAA